MTLSIDSGQLTLSKRPDVTCLPLVVLQTFTDRDASTVASTYYWTRGVPLKYQWDGVTSVWFEPLLESISPIVRGFDHIPNAGVFSTRETVRISLDATERAGEFLWEVLTGENLIGARVTIASLLAAFDADDPRTFDLSSLGDVHLVRWRGEVTIIPTMSDEDLSFELVCETEESPVTLSRPVLAETAAEGSFGRRYPILIGTAKAAKAIDYDSGDTTALDGEISDTDTVIDVVDASNFRPFLYSSGLPRYYFRIGEEVIWSTSLSQLAGGTWRFSSCNRGSGAVAHEDGAGVSEMPPATRMALSAGRCYKNDGIYISVGGVEKEAVNAFVDTNYLVDPEGPIAFVTALTLWNDGSGTGTFVLNFDIAGSSKFFEIEADIEGDYDIGSTPTTLLDFGSDTFKDELLSASLSQPSSDLVINCNDEYVQVIGPGPLGDLSGDEIRIVLNIDAVNLSNLYWVAVGFGNDVLDFYGGSTGTGISNQLDFQMGTFVYASELSSGDNTIRISGGSNRRRYDATAVDHFRIIIVWLDANSTRTLTLKGTADLYSMTQVSDHPIDVAERMVDELYNAPNVSVDASSFSAAKTNLPSAAVGGDIVSRSAVLAESLADLGFECRTNFTLVEESGGTVIKAFNADSSYAFAAASRTIEEFRDLKVTTRQISEIANQFSFIYNRQPLARPDDPSGYRNSVTVDESANPWSADVPTGDITSSQASYGVRKASTLAFSMLADAASVQEVAAYYVQEAINGARMRYSLVAPWWLAYDLEPGDVVEVTPRWKTSAVKLRVVQVSFNFREPGVGLNLEEVL